MMMMRSGGVTRVCVFGFIWCGYFQVLRVFKITYLIIICYRKMTQNAVDTDRPQVFYNPDSGIQGQAEIIQLEMLSMQETGQKDKVQKCKIIRQIITFKDGREISENTTICKKLDK